MKKNKGRINVLKKILVIAFVISLLANHIMILGEFSNIALATEVEWQSDFTSNVRTEDDGQINPEEEGETDTSENTTNTNNEEQSVEELPVEEISEENTAEVSEENVAENEENQTSEEIVSEEEKNEVDLNTTVPEETQPELSEEELQALQEITANTGLQINKLIKYDNESGKGTLVDLTFKFDIDTKDFDVDSVELDFTLPNISDVLPTIYKVEEISDNMEIVQDDEAKRIYLTINEVVNHYEEELRMTLIYSEETFSGTEVKINGGVKVNVQGYQVLGEFNETQEAKETSEPLANYSLNTDTSSRYKGYLYANNLLENKKDIAYTTTNVVDVKDANFIDEIIVENNIDKFVSDTRGEIDLINQVSYKTSSVSVDEFDSILGSGGYIEIYNVLGEKLGEINKSSEIVNNRYVFNYSTDVDRVIFRIINAESNKTLNIKNDKVLKGTDDFSREYISSFKSIKFSSVNKIAKNVNDNEIIVQQIQSESSMNLEETESRMTLELDKTDFITTEQNEVTFSVTLKTNEERYDLFRNPTISIELPSAVQNVEIKNVNLMYKNGLSLSSWNVVQNEMGTNTIQVALEGTQAEYAPGTLIEGTTVLITANLDLNKITANGKSSVKLRYTNEAGNNISYEVAGKASEDVEVNYVSRSGILKEAKLENFNDANDVLVTYEDETVVGAIEANNTGKTAKVSTVVMNNYANEIGNVQIVGKIPYIGNTKDGVDLNTTFNTTLAGPVTLNGLVGKVYYSTEENPDKDSGNWQENITDFSQIKSFKVVVENPTMKVGEKIEISYNLNIPENVGYNASAYNLITTYYNLNNQEVADSSILGLESEVKALAMEDCQVIEETPELTIGTQVTRGGETIDENDQINEGQILRYNVVLTNNTSNPITNVKLKGYGENTNSYYWYTYTGISSNTGTEILKGEWKEDTDGTHIYEEGTIDSILPGETKTFSYQVKVKKLEDANSDEVYGKITISADGIEEKEYQTIKNKIRNANIELIMDIAGEEDASDENMYLRTKDIYNFTGLVTNISDKDLENVKVNVIVPELLELSSEEMSLYNEDVNFSEENSSTGKIVTFIIPKLTAGESKKVIVSAYIKSIDFSIYETSLTIKANSSIDGQLYLSNDYTRKVVQTEAPLNITYTSTPENGATVKNGDKVNYTITLQNTGVVDRYVDFTDFLDDGYIINSAIITLPDGSTNEMDISSNNYIMEFYTLKPGEQLVIVIDGIVDTSDLRTGQTIIESDIDIYPTENLNEFENIVFHIDPSQVPEVPSDGTSDDNDSELPADEEDNNGDQQTSEEETSNIISEDENNVTDNDDITNNTNNITQPENSNDEMYYEESNNNNNSQTDTDNNESNVHSQEEQNIKDVTNENNMTSDVIDTTNVDSVKYSISGKAWLDDNKNGIYDEEELLDSIGVMLLKNDDSSYVNDSNIIQKTTTNKNGEYIFSDLEEGRYIVVFDYDNSIYEVSSYQATGKSADKISVVVGKTLKLNNNEKTYAVSDIVEVAQSNVNNINMALKENSDFDMAITTYIKRVTIENEKGTEVEEFTADDRVAKVEIASKYLDSTNITVEYAIRVTNNGKVGGYINQIADYIPQELVFDNASSINWELSDNNTLYSSSLNKILIAPGESQEINLILTKAMNGESTGVYKNTAEILDLTNDLRLSDSNLDNNKSEVELMVTVKTGAVYYILVIVIALALAFIAMLIVTKLLKEDKKKIKLINKIIIITSIIIIIALCFIIKIYGASYNYWVVAGADNDTGVATTARDYVATSYTIGEKIKYPSEDEYNRRGAPRQVQCVEGNITTPGGNDGGTAKILTEAKISGLDFSTRKSSGTESGSSAAAAKYAYISEKIESNSSSSWRGVMSYALNNDKGSLESVIKVSGINGSATNAGNYDNLWSEASTYANNLKTQGVGVEKSNTVSKLQYNSDYDAFGAITAKYPKNAKLEISLNGSDTGFKQYTGKVIYNGQQKNFSECSEKAFYIPFSAVESADDLNKVKIRISVNTEVIYAKILTCFQSKVAANEGQNQAVMRGYKENKYDEESYTLDAIADVTLTKEVIRKSLTNENIYSTGTNIKEGDYVDRKDIVYFKIVMQNNGMAVKIDLKDTFDTNQYEFVGMYHEDLNTNDCNVSGGTITKNNITLPKKSKYTYYVALRVKENVSADSNTQLTNTAEISNFRIGDKVTINKKGNQTKDSTYVKCKQYNISIEKTVNAITSANGAPKSTVNSVEVGDVIQYKVVVKNNNGSASDAYGAITYKVSETVPDGFAVTESSGWTKEGNNYVYEATLNSGGTTTKYISMRVTESLLSKESQSRTNYVEIVSARNRNSVDLINGGYLINSNLKSESTVKILGYNISVSKKVTSINNGKVTDLTKCELGDTITYTIQVTNTGRSSADFGNIYNIVLDDTFDAGQLQFLSASGSGWTRNSNTSYTYNGPLAPGQTATLTINMKVILQSKDKVQISNTATVSTAVNKNNVTLTHIVPTSSTATMEYQIYELEVRKYLSSHNSQAVTGRESMTNTAKYDSPVEVEKYDNIVYTIVLRNRGTTILHNATLVDTLEDGLTYSQTVSMTKYKSNGSKDSTSSNIKETVNGNQITYNYSGELNAGEYIVIELKCDITKSNMYLLNLKNELKITSIFNRNEIDLIPIDMIKYTNNDNIEYVRLKNLVLSGKVWVDTNRDGKMDDNEGKLSGIEVILHDDTNKKVATTFTDAQGNYLFGETNGKNADGSDSNKKMVEGGDNSGRIIKATNRDDTTGNYNENSRYINYYVEFYYNGVRYTSTVYAGNDGMQNINKADNSITTAYMTDSNAYEYSDVRDEFNNNLETIEYNKGINGTVENGNNTQNITYTKDGHISTLDLTENSGMSAYSFIMQNQPHNGNIQDGKNINMLFFSEEGETEYLKYINLGLQTRDFDISIDQDVYSLKTTVNGTEMTYYLDQGNKSNSPYGGEYVTGGEQNPINYQFKLYASDYYYKHTQYTNQDVVDYKVNTELNTEITYKMTITNHDVQDDNNVYTKVREVVDYYSQDFIKYDPNSNTKTIKVMGEDGYLQDKVINNVEAWYEFIDSNNQKITGEVTLSNNPIYPEHAKVDLGTNDRGEAKYDVVYLSGFDNINLSEGDSFDIYIKFVVDTEDGTTATNQFLGDKNNIVEINAYSTYYADDNRPAGYVDTNSNPGNLGLQTDANNPNGTENANIEDYSEYENDAYKTGVTLSILKDGDSDNPDPDDPEDTDNEGTLERVIKGSVWDDARSTTSGQGGDTQYRGNGIKNIGVDSKIAEAASNQKVDEHDNLLLDESTDQPAEGIKVNLVEIVNVPKNGENRIYEESIKTWDDSIMTTRTSEDGSYTLESFIPGEYIVRFDYGESVEDVVYNGQEYKSTTYYNIDDKITEEPDTGDKVLSALEEENKSDARDDEIRRLEVIRYSETVNNRKTEEAQKNLPEEYSEEFMENTNMNANTESFPIRAEKTTYDIKEYTFDQYESGVNSDLRYKVENIDFGIEYRPEVNVSIEEFISEIKLTTSDGNILADINFDNVYEEADGVQSGRIIGTTINTETSVGYENLQYLPTVDDVKGLAYLNVDEDILQGCTVDITYVFSVNNDSEVDRISQNLYKLRYKVDATGYEQYFDDEYTAAGTARNELYSKYFKTDGATYRTAEKTTYDGTNGYYGKYLGETYYSGNVGSNDIVAELKVNKILDYVDNNMTMQQDKNQTENRYWRTMANEELLDQGLVAPGIFKVIQETIKQDGETQVQGIKQLLDEDDVTYDVDTRHNLAVSVDDRISENDSNNLNKALSIFLKPHVSDFTKSAGSVYMVASKVVSGESDTEDMVYDNSAEIIEYTSVTGRVTKLSTTVGNLNMNSNPEYEDDSDFTERITLAPPTGLEKAEYYLSIARDQIVMVAIVIAVVIVVIILKRSLKNVTFKKFYK